MYTIIMNSDKSLSKTIETTLYQGENLVDKIKFLIPKTYGESDLSAFTVWLVYLDGGNVRRSEKLVLSDPNYKDSMLCYYVPVNSTLTKFAGNIKIHLTLSGDSTQLLHSGDANIYIAPVDPCYHKVVVSPDSSGGNSGENSGDEEGFYVVEF